MLAVMLQCHVGCVQDASSLESGSEYKGDIDIGRELAVLHCVLRDCLNISEVSVSILLHYRPMLSCICVIAWRSKRDVRRSIKLADFVCQENRPTKICHLSCKNRPILSADKIVRFYCPTRTRSILDDKVGQLLGYQSLWWLFTVGDEYLFYLFLFIFVHYVQKKIMQVSFSSCILLLCICETSWYRAKLQTIKSAVCHGSTILSADFLEQLNHAHKSWPTLSIVWHPLKDDNYQLVSFWDHKVPADRARLWVLTRNITSI